MKFRKIEFENHPILGTLSLNFTDVKGKTIDTIILAGENGCGKSVLLNELFEYNPTALYDNKSGKVTTEIELSPSEITYVQQIVLMNGASIEFSDGILIIEQDYSIKDYKQNKVYSNNINGEKQLSYGYVLSNNGKSIFKPIFSDVEINFTPQRISNVTSLNIDEEINNPIRSGNKIATEITQLLIDIDDLDNSDLARWVDNNPGQVPPEEVKRRRIKRFTNAFYSMFPQKRFIGVDNFNGHKSVLFEEFGKRMPIEKLSSGEKQIVFRGGFLLKNQRSLEGAAVLVDEPEISLHPKWQLEIMTFLKKLFSYNGEQSSQIIVATHSPFIIHNATRSNDKVIVLKKDEDGRIIALSTPEYYSWTEAQIVKDAFDINTIVEDNKINVFLEGETDEKYFKKTMAVYGIDDSLIAFHWIGHNSNGRAENTGSSALNDAVRFFKANQNMIWTPIVMLYDCDTNKGCVDYGNLHVRSMTTNKNNLIYKKGIENLLDLPEGFEYEKYYSKYEKCDDYGAISINQTLDKMKLCDDICSFGDDLIRNITKNVYHEIEKILAIGVKSTNTSASFTNRPPMSPTVTCDD